MTSSENRANRWQFWIDRGGTFTDIVALTPDGALTTHKLLSENPEHYDDAGVAGMRALMELGPDAPFPAERVGAIKMGTTIATNALLERNGEPTVLAITRGFRDALRIGDAEPAEDLRAQDRAAGDALFPRDRDRRARSRRRHSRAQDRSRRRRTRPSRGS